jgi:hypothetical protein
MSVYIAIFFLMSQVISFILFKQIPDDRILLGGGFIVIGGLLILVMTLKPIGSVLYGAEAGTHLSKLLSVPYDTPASSSLTVKRT